MLYAQNGATDAELRYDEHGHLKHGNLGDLVEITTPRTDLGFHGTDFEDGRELAEVHCSPENKVAGDVGDLGRPEHRGRGRNSPGGGRHRS